MTEDKTQNMAADQTAQPDPKPAQQPAAPQTPPPPPPLLEAASPHPDDAASEIVATMHSAIAFLLQEAKANNRDKGREADSYRAALVDLLGEPERYATPRAQAPKPSPAPTQTPAEMFRQSRRFRR